MGRAPAAGLLVFSLNTDPREDRTGLLSPHTGLAADHAAASEAAACVVLHALGIGEGRELVPPPFLR